MPPCSSRDPAMTRAARTSRCDRPGSANVAYSPVREGGPEGREAVPGQHRADAHRVVVDAAEGEQRLGGELVGGIGDPGAGERVELTDPERLDAPDAARPVGHPAHLDAGAVVVRRASVTTPGRALSR